MGLFQTPAGPVNVPLAARGEDDRQADDPHERRREPHDRIDMTEIHAATFVRDRTIPAPGACKGDPW